MRRCWSRRWRRAVITISTFAVLLAGGVGLTTAGIRVQTWPGGYQNARCIGTWCLITSPFLELSNGEYATPVPTTPPLSLSPTGPVPTAAAACVSTSAQCGYGP